MSADASLIVLDDDPTGAQAQAGVPVALEWGAELLAAVAETKPPAVHLLTNTRALSADRARVVTGEAAAAAAAAFPDSRIVLRGDSTLRAHLLPEYVGLRDAVFPGRTPVLMLVPALPAAGRVTEGGVHYLERDGERTSLERTEYARDPDFAYASARLLDWAQERSAGFFPASAGRELRIEELRSDGAAAVSGALVELSERRSPAVLAVDSTEDADLELVAAGLREAERAGADVAVRSAPAFVGILSGAGADRYQPLPSAGSAVLVLCGSHVPRSTRQLETLVLQRPESVVWVRPERLANGRGEQEIAAAAAAAADRLQRGGLAVVATSRAVLDSDDRLQAGAAIASGLAAILARVREHADVVVSKGGITSAVNLREGLESGLAEVLGPLRDGISLWSVDTPERKGMPFIVFPGNVGGDDDLADLVAKMAVPS
ncbi:MAG: four-carbon acid sugar kinase family protein [Solirubrobacteraceae bacterium]